MSAPLSEALFHASSHPFKVGDTVVPKGGEHAFATTSLGYAKKHIEDIKGGGGNIFTVEPVDAKEMAEEGKKIDVGSYRISKKGFKVTGKA